MIAPWRWARRGLGVLVLLSLGVLAGTLAGPEPRPEAAHAVSPPARPVQAQVGAAAVDSLHAKLVALAPFRSDRLPVEPRPFDVVAQASPPIRPVLVLTAVAWGARPAAVIEGLPGVEGSRVVLAGDTVGGLVIRSVARMQVVVTAPDTTWVLRLEGGPP